MVFGSRFCVEFALCYGSPKCPHNAHFLCSLSSLVASKQNWEFLHQMVFLMEVPTMECIVVY